MTAADVEFYTGYSLSEEEAERYMSIAEIHLNADGGAGLSGEIRVEALCYFIASRLANKTERGITSESIGGYTYSRRASISSSHWLDLYRELLPVAAVGVTSSANSGVRRVDERVVNMNRRYT